MKNTTQFLLPVILLLLAKNSVAQVYGCTDPLAVNYNSSATNNDGSCVYAAASVSPVTSVNLPGNLVETSGLLHWNSMLLTHNDNTDTAVYSIDSMTGSILQTYPLPGVNNQDWEDLADDSAYIYLGDFGNNVNGNRTDLHILRIEKNSLLAGSPVIDTIRFFYADQTDFTPTGANNTDYDCEAMVVWEDSIYLFTKQWNSQGTALYALPKFPGNHAAIPRSGFNTQGMITGSVLMAAERIIALCGYTSILQPFVWLLYDFSPPDFFSGNKRMLTIPLAFHQIEGIAASGGLIFYMTNEYFSIITTQQKLHTFDFMPYLGNYVSTLSASGFPEKPGEPVVFPNPALEMVSLYAESKEPYIRILDITGKECRRAQREGLQTDLYIGALSSGTYFLEAGGKYFKFIKLP